MRSTSPSGMRWAMRTDSYADTMAKDTWGSKNVAFSEQMMMSASPSM